MSVIMDRLRRTVGRETTGCWRKVGDRARVFVSVVDWGQRAPQEVADEVRKRLSELGEGSACEADVCAGWEGDHAKASAEAEIPMTPRLERALAASKFLYLA